jgi:hypothetical protein
MITADRYGGVTTGGTQVRLLNLPAEPSPTRSEAKASHGAFENLHEFGGGAALADHLRTAARCYYGTALPAFIDHLCSMDERDVAGHIRDAVEHLHATVRKVWGIETVPAQIGRMLDRLAIIMAAGTIATKAGILPWPEAEARNALTQITKEWLDDRGSVEAGEQLTILDHLRRVLFMERDRFVMVTEDAAGTLCLDERRVSRQLGYIKGADFFIPPEVFNREFVPAGMNGTTARRQLAAAGVLVREVSAEGKERYTVRPYLPDADGNVRQMRMVHVRGSVLHDTGGGDDGNAPAGRPAGRPAASAKEVEAAGKLADAARRLGMQAPPPRV